MSVDPVLAVVAIWRLTGLYWKAMDGHEWFPYIYEEEEIMVLPAEPRFVRYSTKGAKLREGGIVEVRSRYREESARRGVSMDSVRLVWRRYPADDADLSAITMFEEQNALNSLASLITSVALADVEVFA